MVKDSSKGAFCTIRPETMGHLAQIIFYRDWSKTPNMPGGGGPHFASQPFFLVITKKMLYSIFNMIWSKNLSLGLSTIDLDGKLQFQKSKLKGN